MGIELSHRINSTYYALQFFVFFILFCFLSISSAINTIKANQSLSNSEVLISKQSRFKLSFFSPPNSSRRYVGVMYNLPVMTVVWVANRNQPLNDSSGSFQISSDGNLVILDGRREIVWSTNLSTSVVNSRSVTILDTGNLVLQDEFDEAYVWESFQHPSDSWLEKMDIMTDLSRNKKNMLTSWTSPDDPAPGRFTFTIEPSGIPQLFVWKDGKPYCRSGPFTRRAYDYGAFVGGDYPGTAELTFALSNSSILQYFVLSSSGNVEERVWSDRNKAWDVLWSSISHECDVYGKCGPFGMCNAEGRSMCTCFPGFIPESDQEWVAGNWSSGCTRETNLKCGEDDEFVKMESVKLPDHFKWDPSFQEECKGACMSNCSCTAYAYSSRTGCLHWTGNLTDVMNSTSGEDLYVRVTLPMHKHNKKDSRPIIVTTVVFGFTLIAICAYFLPKLLSLYRERKHRNRLIFSDTKGTLQHDSHRVELPIFQFRMLSNATGNFDPVNKLGQGGFGLVYKGKFANGEEIAVKRLAKSSNQGVEEFMNEVEVISQLQHRNLVRLIGCCVEYGEKMLVYEYMPNGSLDAYLFSSQNGQYIDWKTCKCIIKGICRGLLYLHRDSRLKIIHRDLKASNILLDEELNPKISDFGMARIFCGKDHQANTHRVVGTYGYMSPEYALHGFFSEKSDVYSLGVLLIEILSGRKNSNFCVEDQQLFQIPYAWNLWNEGKIVKLIDPAIYDSAMEDDIVRYANVGLLCVQEIASDRPNVSTVLSMLSCEIVELPRPKQPAFLAMQTSQNIDPSAESSSKCSVNNVTTSIVEGR